MSFNDKALGCIEGMLIGDAMSYPSMQRGRYETLPWMNRIMNKVESHGAKYNYIKPVLPFIWSEGSTLHPTPTYASEFALFTGKMLVDLQDEINQEQIFAYWKKHIVENETEIRTSLSERGAIENIKKGLVPPYTGNDHPHTYDDGFVVRAIAIGLGTYENSLMRSNILKWDGTITHADDGLAAGYAMAESIAIGCQGASPEEMVMAGKRMISENTWLKTQCDLALEIVENYDSAFAAIPELDQRLTTRVYNYGNMATETLPIAYSLFLLSNGSLEKALPLAYCFPRLADSVPAFVGALCGVLEGSQRIPDSFADYCNPPSGLCIPSLKDFDVKKLIESIDSQVVENTYE